MAERIVIFTAVATEAQPVIRRLDLCRVDATRYADDQIVLQITGMGAANAHASAESLLAEEQPRHVVIAGLCGALDAKLKVADVLEFTHVLSSGSKTYAAASSGLASAPLQTILYTADHLVPTPAEKAQLRQSTGAAAVDMESAAIVALCEARGIHWRCIRAVSDTADQVLPDYLAAMVDPSGRPVLRKVLAQLLPHPLRIGALLSIGRQSRAAAEALAVAVADTLHH